MSATTVRAIPLATFTLELALAVEGRDVTPRRELVTGIEGGEADLEVLRAELETGAQDAFRPRRVAVERPEFKDPGPGVLTVTFDVVTPDGVDVTAHELARGVTVSTDRSGKPLTDYLTKVLDEPGLDVTVVNPYVALRESLPPKPEPEPEPTDSLTEWQRVWAWGITGGSFVLVAVFVFLVLFVFE